MPTPNTHAYKLQVVLRFMIAFVLGYICSAFLHILLSDFFILLGLARAESIYLSAFFSLIFMTLWVIYSFILQSLKKLTIMAVVITIVLFFVRYMAS